MIIIIIININKVFVYTDKNLLIFTLLDSSFGIVGLISMLVI